MPSLSGVRLTREGVCRTFGFSQETLRALESEGVLAPDADQTFDLTRAATALARHGMRRAAQAEEKLAAVAAALHDALPALQRLAELPDRAMLDAWAHERAKAELAAFFSAFSELIARGSAALDRPEVKDG